MAKHTMMVPFRHAVKYSRVYFEFSPAKDQSKLQIQMVGLLRFHVQVNIFAVPVPTAGLGHFVWETDTSDNRYM